MYVRSVTVFGGLHVQYVRSVTVFGGLHVRSVSDSVWWFACTFGQ